MLAALSYRPAVVPSSSAKSVVTQAALASIGAAGINVVFMIFFSEVLMKFQKIINGIPVNMRDGYSFVGVMVKMRLIM